MSPDRYRHFRIEARELADALRSGAMGLGAGPSPQGAVTAMLRQAHTLKGAARVVGLASLADLAHQAEAQLEALRDGALPPPAGAAGRVLALLESVDAELNGLDAPPSPAPQLAADPLPPVGSVRLGVKELDELIDLQRSARLRLAQMAELAAGRGPASALAQGLEQAGRDLASAQLSAGRMRLAPVSRLFYFLEQVCGDAAGALGKAVRFEAAGGGLRLEAPLLLALQDGLQHIVRNAVVHGIEPPEARAKAGKAACGIVGVALTLASRRLLIHCWDDGQGLDLGAIGAAAKARGLWDGSGALSEKAAGGLLLSGGLTTSRELTELAGRGLGMGILRSVVERLKGSLQLSSGQGHGLDLRIEVPARLSAYAALEVEAGGRACLIPFRDVRSARHLGPLPPPGTPLAATLMEGSAALPLLPLAACLGVLGLRPRVAVVMGDGEGRFALGLDRVRGVRDALVQPLPEMAPACPLALGVSLDEAGDPCLVLDLAGLGQAAREPRDAWPSGDGPVKALPLLVVDDSLTTRMLELSILETAGYAVDLAASAEEGLARLRERRYGLLLVDVEMPGMSGFEMLELLRQDPELKGIPAILVTSCSSPADRCRGVAAGARDYIVKGEFDQSRLLGRIRELLS